MSYATEVREYRIVHLYCCANGRRTRPSVREGGGEAANERDNICITCNRVRIFFLNYYFFNCVKLYSGTHTMTVPCNMDFLYRNRLVTHCR